MPAQHGFGFHNEHRGSPTNEPPTRQNPEEAVGVLEAWPWFVCVCAGPAAVAGGKDCICDQQRCRTSAAIAHSKQRNIDLYPLLLDGQEAEAVQCRQWQWALRITILRPSRFTQTKSITPEIAVSVSAAFTRATAAKRSSSE